MNKSELKKILKPLIKECIREVLLEEEGALSHVIKEVASGLSSGKQQIAETRTFQPPKQTMSQNNDYKQQRKKLLNSIGKDAYKGCDLFEGTTPTPAPAEGTVQGPLSGVAANDPGVDISSIFGARAFAMSKRMMENK